MLILTLFSFLPFGVDPIVSKTASGDSSLPRSLAEEDRGLALTLETRASYVVPSGWLFITRGSEPGSATALHVDDQIDPEPEFVPSVEGCFRLLENHAVGARLALFSLSGTGADEQPFIFHGTTFDAGRPVRSELNFQFIEIDYQYAFNPRDALRITAHLGAEMWNFSAR